MKLNKIALVTGLAGSGILVGSVFAPAQALTWNFDYTSPTGSGTVDSILTTNGNSYTTNTIYDITGISGTVNGNPITGLITSTPGNPGFIFDNSFVWNGSTGILLTDNGLGFLDASTLAHNIYSKDGTLFSNAVSDFASTNLQEFAVTTGNPPYISTPSNQDAPVAFSSLTPVPTPEPSNTMVLGSIAGLGLIGGLKRKLSGKK